MLVATSRRDRTSSVVVLGPARSALLIDPAWTPDELDGIARDLTVLRLRVVAALSTHAHFDHLLWHPGFGDVPRYASAGTVRRAAEQRLPLLDELGPGYPVTALRSTPPIRVAPLVLRWGGPEALAIVTDAHEPGHTSFWFPALGLLVAGDLLSDGEPPLLADGDDGTAYAAGLDALEPFVRRARLVIPGHGSPTGEPLSRLDADRARLGSR